MDVLRTSGSVVALALAMLSLHTGTRADPCSPAACLGPMRIGLDTPGRPQRQPPPALLDPLPDLQPTDPSTLSVPVFDGVEFRPAISDDHVGPGLRWRGMVRWSLPGREVQP